MGSYFNIEAIYDVHLFNSYHTSIVDVFADVNVLRAGEERKKKASE
jgi:hypothetical protein